MVTQAFQLLSGVSGLSAAVALSAQHLESTQLVCYQGKVTMKPIRTKYLIPLSLAALVTGCGSPTLRTISGAANETKSCVNAVASKPEFASLRIRTNIERPEFINAQMVIDKSFVTPDEAIALKSLVDEYFPCKKKLFEELIATAPDLQIPLIRTEIAARKNVNQLISKKITWGQFNAATVNYNAKLMKEAAPALLRIQRSINLEERQAAIQRQQAIALLAILANTAINLHAIAEANRPVLTSCVRAAGGNYNCVSQ